MMDADKYIEFRQRVIETLDVYDLVDLLCLTVEDWLDNTTDWEENVELMFQVGIISYEEYEQRTKTA